MLAFEAKSGGVMGGGWRREPRRLLGSHREGLSDIHLLLYSSKVTVVCQRPVTLR